MRTSYQQDDDLLTLIREGMAVDDHEGKRVGVVEFVKFTDKNSSMPSVETVGVANYGGYERRSVIRDIRDGLVADDDLPDNLRSRLMREGYIRIDGGFLSPDRVATLNQIADVSDESVTLSVSRDELITL